MCLLQPRDSLKNDGAMLNPTRLWILFAACALLQSFSSAQDRPQRKYVFSGAVTEVECSKLPALSFNIKPPGDRGKTEDRLTVQCVPRKQDHSAMLSLTFTLAEQPPSSADIYERRYSFRWGELKDSRAAGLDGQFTKDPKLCTSLADLFGSKVSKTITSTSEHLPRSPQWSAGCFGDARWGTSMEIVLIGKFPESL